MVQRLRASRKPRKCAMESTWSKNFDIGNAAISFSKGSSQGAFTGSQTRLRSTFGVRASRALDLAETRLH